MIPILCGNDISFCHVFCTQIGERGCYFSVTLKMCGHRFPIFGQIDKKLKVQSNGVINEVDA